MTEEFQHKLNKGRIFLQMNARGKQPQYTGKANVQGETMALSGWKNDDGSISLQFETIAQFDAAIAKHKKERRRKER